MTIRDAKVFLDRYNACDIAFRESGTDNVTIIKESLKALYDNEEVKEFLDYKLVGVYYANKLYITYAKPYQF